eukprot:746962-Hanusia_phi.AAC.13
MAGAMLAGRRRLTKEELGIRDDEEQEIYESPGNGVDEDGAEEERAREISLMEKELDVGRQAADASTPAPKLVMNFFEQEGGKRAETFESAWD